MGIIQLFLILLLLLHFYNYMIFFMFLSNLFSFRISKLRLSFWIKKIEAFQWPILKFKFLNLNNTFSFKIKNVDEFGSQLLTGIITCLMIQRAFIQILENYPSKRILQNVRWVLHLFLTIVLHFFKVMSTTLKLINFDLFYDHVNN